MTDIGKACLCQYHCIRLLRLLMPSRHAQLQDTARSFAGENDDKSKFALYMTATHFAETVQNLNDAKELVTQMLDILRHQGRHCKVSTTTIPAGWSTSLLRPCTTQQAFDSRQCTSDVVMLLMDRSWGQMPGVVQLAVCPGVCTVCNAVMCTARLP